MAAKFSREDEPRGEKDSWFQPVVNKKILRIKARSEFQSILREGLRVKLRNWLIVNYLETEDKTVKIGWTIPAYTGTAVLRNKFKRWIKAEVLQNWVVTEKISQGCRIHFYFLKKEKQFYRGLEREEFNRTLLQGLRDVENKIKFNH